MGVNESAVVSAIAVALNSPASLLFLCLIALSELNMSANSCFPPLLWLRNQNAMRHYHGHSLNLLFLPPILGCAKYRNGYK